MTTTDSQAPRRQRPNSGPSATKDQPKDPRRAQSPGQPHGVPAPGACDPDARNEDIRFLAANGETTTGAAERLGIKTGTLWKWCNRYGLNDEWAALAAREAVAG